MLGMKITHIRSPCIASILSSKQRPPDLKEWSRNLLSETKLQLHMALDIILQLDKAQEFRVLTPEETELCKKLKHRVLGLSVLERARKRQASRITNIELGCFTS